MPLTRSHARQQSSTSHDDYPGESNDHDEGHDENVSQEQSDSDEDEDEERQDDIYSDEDDQDDSGESGLQAMVRAHSMIVYDIVNLDRRSRAQALAGLRGNFDMVYCRVEPSGFEFQLTEHPQIRISSQAMRCSCSESDEDQSAACRHIFVSLQR